MRSTGARSTAFVIVSLVIHSLAFAAMVMTPIHTVSTEGERIEVTVGDKADQPGVAAAPSPEDSKPEAIAAPQPQAPVKEEAVAPTPPPPPKAVVAKPIAAKPVAAKAKPAPAKVITAAAEPSDDASSPVVAATPAEKEDAQEQPKEDLPVLTPVKDSAPAGVEAATDDVPEAKNEVPPEPVAAPAPAPTPAPVAAAAPVTDKKSQEAMASATTAAATTKGTSSAPATTGELNKGGATKEGAVAYTDLKQKPGNKPPPYPLQARLENRQGNMELLYRVTKEGKVADITVAKSSGSKDLDDSAVKAISQYRFYPGQEGWAKHPVNFNLKGNTAALPSKLRSSPTKQAESDD